MTAKTRHIIPTAKWATVLEDTIESANDGDIVIVHNVAMQELAELARWRTCPDKELIFEVGQQSAE